MNKEKIEKKEKGIKIKLLRKKCTSKVYTTSELLRKRYIIKKNKKFHRKFEKNLGGHSVKGRKIDLKQKGCHGN